MGPGGFRAAPRSSALRNLTPPFSFPSRPHCPPSLTPAVTSQQRPREAGWGNLTDSGPELARNFAARPRAGPGPDFGASSRNQGGGPRSSRRRVFGCPDRAFLRRFRAQTGRENRPFAPIGGGPSQPISGRRVNLGFRDTSSGGGRKVGVRGPVKNSLGGDIGVFGGAPPGVPIACFTGGPGRKRGSEIDRPRGPAGAQVSEQF